MMVRRNGARSNGSDSDSYWEGYSNYKSVASSIAESIDNAMAAYAKLSSLHAEGARVKPKDSAEARSDIVLAALKLVPELREDAQQNEDYQQILARWHGSVEIEQENGTPKKVQPKFPNRGPDSGYFEALNGVRLERECPAWLEDWVLDIRTAGWELGYLKAGRRQKDRSGLDPVEEEARQMFE